MEPLGLGALAKAIAWRSATRSVARWCSSRATALLGRGLRHVELLLVLDACFAGLFVELQTGENLDITRRAADIRHSRAGRSRPGLEVEPGSRKLPLRVGFIVEAALIGGLKA